VIQHLPSTSSERQCQHQGAEGDTAPLVAHLDAAYNLARWLARNETDAEDLVQEAYLRAFSHFESFRGGDGRPWLLTIVRNCFYDSLKKNGVHHRSVFDESIHSGGRESLTPETSLLEEEKTELMREALEELPLGLREVLVLRELEEMSYKEIANIAGIPLGTVMSRLSRARQQIQQNLRVKVEREKPDPQSNIERQ
jgi:RNA polymerase sigma-70 factor, ECF subfamily